LFSCASRDQVDGVEVASSTKSAGSVIVRLDVVVHYSSS
jgi:hypothetical protein